MHPTPHGPNPLKNPVGSPWMAKLASCQSSARDELRHGLLAGFQRRLVTYPSFTIGQYSQSHTQPFFQSSGMKGVKCSSSRDIRNGFTNKKKTHRNLDRCRALSVQGRRLEKKRQEDTHSTRSQQNFKLI